MNVIDSNSLARDAREKALALFLIPLLRPTGPKEPKSIAPSIADERGFEVGRPQGEIVKR